MTFDLFPKSPTSFRRTKKKYAIILFASRIRSCARDTSRKRSLINEKNHENHKANSLTARSEKKLHRHSNKKLKLMFLLCTTQSIKLFYTFFHPIHRYMLTFRDAECNPSKIRRGLMTLRLAACTFTVYIVYVVRFWIIIWMYVESM